MNSFEFEIDDKSRAGSEFMARVANEIRRAVVAEKSTRKLTQQAIADKIGTSRSVINREISGLENLTARRIGELLWAIGWEPYFEAQKLPAFPQTNQLPSHFEILSGGAESEGQTFVLIAPPDLSDSNVTEPVVSIKVGTNAA